MKTPKNDNDWIKLKRKLEKDHKEIFYYMTLQQFKKTFQFYLGGRSTLIH